MTLIKRHFAHPKLHTPMAAAVVGLLLIMGTIAISAHGFFAFLNIEGLLIVVGGVVAVAFMSYPKADVRKALRAIRDMLDKSATSHENLHRDAMNIIKWARLVKDKGLRALETSIGKSGIDDFFVKYGLNMVVSDYTPDEVRMMMETAADSCYERDMVPVDILESMASHGPAFGMVGTLVGMVAMLSQLGDDMSGIGASLAVAFLSTLYGVVSARMFYMPAAARLRQEVEKTRFRNHLITEGMVLLVADKPPMFIQDRMNSFLRPEMHDYFNVFVAQSTPRHLRVVGQ